jgi:chromosome partitioning protein
MADMATEPTQDAQADDLLSDDLGTLHRKALTILKRIRDGALDPETGTKRGPTFPISKAAALVGRTASAIREAERDGRLPERGRTGSGHRVHYSLDELDQMREVFGTRPWRSPTDTPAIISISNFKGGVAKTTIALHMAQHFAIRGYRVLLIDCDSQASTTMMFGYRPDVDLGEDDTLYGHFHNPELLGVRKIIRKTHFHGLDLIPANLKLYNLEYEIAGYLAQNQSFDIIDMIAHAIDEVVDDYDVVIMDPPPALGMVSMAVLQAANAMVIPMPPSVIDFASTVSFIDMARTTMAQLEKLGGRSKPAYNFIKIVGSRVDDSKSMHREILSMMRQVFGGSMINSVLRTSAEIDNASSRMKTVFELERPVTSHEVHNRSVRLLTDVCQDIEAEVLRTWSSRAGALR